MNLFACDPAAGYTTGCVASTSSSFSSPQSARSAPSCELYPIATGLLVEGLRRVGGVEDELDHLPIALVQVVEVVEDVEEPVLERELPGMGGLGRDVGVDGRLDGATRQPVLPELVVAARVERVSRDSRGGTRRGPRGHRRQGRSSPGPPRSTARGARPSAPRARDRRRWADTALPARTPRAARRAERRVRTSRRARSRQRGRRRRAAAARARRRLRGRGGEDASRLGLRRVGSHSVPAGPHTICKGFLTDPLP